MRRGTEAAKAFGKILYDRRIELGLTMRQVADKIGVPAATVSQVEKAQRAVKEEKLELWSEALGFDHSFLWRQWDFVQKRFPDGPIVRTGRRRAAEKTEVEDLLKELTSTERTQVFGYMQGLIDSR